MAPKQQQTLLTMFSAAANKGSRESSAANSKKKPIKKKDSESTEVSAGSRRTPDGQQLPHHSHSTGSNETQDETHHSTMKENQTNGTREVSSSNNPELSPRRKRRRADSISIEGRISGTPDSKNRSQSHRAAKTRKTEKSPLWQGSSPTATAEAEAHPYRHNYDSSEVQDPNPDGSSVQPTTTTTGKEDGPVHTPTTFMMASQTSIDTPPVGVSRLPSQDNGNNSQDDNGHHHDSRLLDIEMRNTLDDDEDDNIDESTTSQQDGEKDRTLLESGYEALVFPNTAAGSGENDDASSLEITTPIPIPRSSMPPSFKFVGSSVRTPRPVRQQYCDQEEPKEESSGNGDTCYIPLAEDERHVARDSCETQERGGKDTRLFGNSPIVDDDGSVGNEQEMEQLGSSSAKKRHTMDLGALFSNSQGGPKRKASSTTQKTIATQKEVGRKHQKVESNGMKGENKESQRILVQQSPALSTVTDPIEEVTQTDDEIERVEAKTSRGLHLLQAASTKTQHTTASSSIGSLFASANVSSNSPASNDLASPLFDPSTFAADKMLHAPPNKDNKSFKFSLVALTFDQIEALKSSGAGSRKKTTTLLTNLFRLVIWWSPKDLIPVMYFCLNKVGPDYEGLEVGIGESTLVKIMVDIYGRSEQSIKSDLKKHEDLGKVAELSRCSMRQLFKPPVLTIQSVFNSLKSLPLISGKNSQEQKRATIKKILAAAEKSEPKSIIRFLQGKMRVGVQSATVYQAVAFAFALTSPQTSPFGPSTRSPISDIRRSSKKRLPAAEIDALLSSTEVSVKTALSEVSNIEVVVKHLFEGCDASTLPTRCVVTPGIPVQPMLAKPTKGLQEVLTRFADCEFTCEFKYDGERAQIHLLPNKSVVVFSRNLENLTQKYPDVINAAKEAFKPEAKECILDSEVVAYDTKAQKIQPFQILSTRKRKGVEAEDVTVQVCIFAFDCIQFNGQSLTKHTFEERRQYLQKCITEVPNKFMFARHSEMNTLEEIDSFFQEAVDANCEGLMVKTLNTNASYEPSKRSLNWLKIKKDYLEHLTDSVDLVPIGAYLGRGKRAKWYGTYLLACYNSDEEVFQTVCKVGTGFTEENLTEFYEHFKTKVTSVKDPSYQVDDKLAADVWFEPCAVWEVRAADLSLSPVHSGGMGLKHPTKGIGLRFPRFIRIRDDKRPEQATTNIQIVEMYDNQFTSTKNVIEDDDDNDDD